jgi:hypothetical protein
VGSLDAQRERIIAVWRAKETKSGCVKYWEIIADNLKKRGWSLGWVSAVDSEGRTISIAEAHRPAESGLSCAQIKS